jgi:sirohydrochlorin ferrochelatase
MLVSTVLFVVWFAVVNIIDRLTFWRFRNSQIEHVHLFASALGRAPESHSVMHARLTRTSDDILADKILGLGFLGLGTSDVDVKIAIFGGGNEQFRIEHVWRATGPLRQVQAMMGPKATVVM